MLYAHIIINKLTMVYISVVLLLLLIWYPDRALMPQAVLHYGLEFHPFVCRFSNSFLNLSAPLHQIH